MSLLESLPIHVLQEQNNEESKKKGTVKKVKIRTKNAALEENEDIVDSESKNAADNTARKNISYQLAMDMKKRNIEQTNFLNEIHENEDDQMPIHQQFKKHIKVDAGSNLRKLQQEIAEQNPSMSISAVKAKAATEMKKLEKEENRLQWTSNLPDSAMLPILRSDQSPEARQLVEAYEDKYAILNAKTDGELALQNSFNDLRRFDKVRTKKTDKSARKKADKLINAASKRSEHTVVVSSKATATVEDDNGNDDDNDNDVDDKRARTNDVAPLDFGVTDRTQLFQAPIIEQKREISESGLVVSKNNFNEPIESDLFSLTKFASLFAAAKTMSEDSMTSDAANFMDRFHTQAVNEFMKMLDSAPADACLTAKGERPSGSMAVDMRRLFEETGFDPSSLSNDRLMKYHSLWQQTHTATPADTENALAIRVNHINRENALQLMRRIGMSEQNIEMAMVHGKNVEYSEFMKCVYNSINTMAFVRAEEQAEADTLLAERVAAELKRGTKEQSASVKAGGRGREALGMKLNSTPQATAKLLGVSLEEIDIPYINEFLRPAIFDGERNCMREDSCLCVIFASTFPSIRAPEGKGCAFVCRELLLPSQKSTFDAHRKLPQHRHLCFVCEIAAVTTSVYDNIENRKEPTMPLHRFSVKIDCKGGFRRELMIEPMVCGTRLTGVIAPFPALNVQNLAYSKTTINGTVQNCIILTGTDFRMGSASNQRT